MSLRHLLPFLLLAPSLGAAFSAEDRLKDLEGNTHKYTRDHYSRLFSEWQRKFQVQFGTDDEYTKRLEIFMDAHDLIETHNTREDATYKLAHNQFSHLTKEEFKAAYLMSQKPEEDPTLPRTLLVEAKDTSTLKSSIDWVSQGAVTPVKNQGQCGSCWSFSTTGALEGAYFNKMGELKSFSEQQLVSCDTTDNGCGGGLMDNAFKFIKSNGGLCLEEEYPYTSSAGSAAECKSGCSVVEGSAVTGYTDVASTEAALKTALNQQPVSIAIEADQSAFQLYSSGVLTGTCGTSLDHGVLAVGYGTDSDSGTDYWKVKNSWGSTWGESGYIRIERSSSDECGVLMQASFPTL